MPVATAPARRLSMLDGVAFSGMFVFGIVMALLGAVMPVVSERLALGLGDVGTLFLVTNGGMLVASLLAGPATDRVGMKAPLALGALVVGVALVGISRAAGLNGLLPAVACLGAGGGALNATTNTLVADLHDDPAAKGSALNLLGVFFGFGALILPFSIGALLSTVGLAGLLLAAAGLCVVTAAVTLALRFPPPKQAHGLPLARMRAFVRMPVVWAFAVLLFFESGNEFVLGGYFATFLTRELTVPVSRASYLLAAYWGAIMVSRFVLSRALRHVGAHWAVLGGALLAAAGAILVAAANTTAIAMAGILLTGLALAGIFPTVLGVAGTTFREHSGTVFGILFTVALAGGMTMPWLAGHLAESAGLRPVFFLAAVNFCTVAVLSVSARRAVSPA
jgi:FHS family glucose/mannose:H+ symporter-like MFS transporter